MKDDLPINIDGSEPFSPTTPTITLDGSHMERYIEEHGEMVLTPTDNEATDDTYLGNNFIKRVRNLRQKMADDVQRTKDAMVTFAGDAEDAISQVGEDLAHKLEELEQLSDISDNWKSLMTDRAIEKHRLEEEQKALRRATKDEDKVVSAGIMQLTFKETFLAAASFFF